MSEQKHTPGPWEVTHSGKIVHYPKRGGCSPVCMAGANARLIAAAPELLEALEMLIDEQNGPPLLLERHRVRWEAAMTAARNAIRKATT